MSPLVAAEMQYIDHLNYIFDNSLIVQSITLRQVRKMLEGLVCE